MADEKKLRLLIEAILDERGFKKSAEALKGLEKQSKQTGEATKQASEHYSKMLDKSSGFLSAFGMVATVLGGAMTPIIKSAQQYVSTVQLANATSREWLATTYQIEQAQVKLGKVNADFLLPTYSKIGDIVEQLGAFVEKNPEVATTAELIGGGATGYGIVNIVKGLLSKTGLGGAGGAAGAETLGLGPFGFLQTLGLGMMGTGGMITPDDPRYKALMGSNPTGANGEDTEDKTFIQLLGDKFDKLVTDFKSIFSGGANTSGVVTTTGAGRQPEVSGGLGPMLGSMKKGDFLPVEFLKAQMQFRKQEMYSQADYNRQLGYMNEDFLRNREYQQKDYDRQLGITQRNFNIQLAQSEKMFYLQRAIALRDFQISVSRNDYDYNLGRKRAQEDQNFSLKQIMLSGDALAYYYSQRQFNISKQRAEEDYQLQKARAQEDFNRSQADSLMFFGIERAFSRQMFEISLADRALEFEIMRDRAKWEFDNVTKKRMEEEYKIMAGRRKDAFYESILPLFLEENKQRAFYENEYLNVSITGYIGAATAMQNYFNALIGTYYGATHPNAPDLEKRAAGGYTEARAYQLHDHEYVLNKGTTKSLESVAQGRLTQDKVLGMLTGGSGGMTYNDNRQFSRGLSITEKTMLKQELRQMVVEAFR